MEEISTESKTNFHKILFDSVELEESIALKLKEKNQ
jgi:hypothetical protein